MSSILKVCFLLLLTSSPAVIWPKDAKIKKAGWKHAEERYGKLKKVTTIKYKWPEEKMWLVPIKFGKFGTGYVNRDIKIRLELVWLKLEILGLVEEISSFQGCYNPRPIRGTETPSYHAYGLACDFVPKDLLGYSEEFITLWKNAGFCVGQGFNDPMHFSYGEC